MQSICQIVVGNRFAIVILGFHLLQFGFNHIYLVDRYVRCVSHAPASNRYIRERLAAYCRCHGNGFALQPSQAIHRKLAEQLMKQTKF